MTHLNISVLRPRCKSRGTGELNGQNNERVATFFLESFSDIIVSKVIICKQRIVTLDTIQCFRVSFIYDFQ